MNPKNTKNLTKKLIFTSAVNVIASLVALGFGSSGAMAIGIAITGINTTTTNGTNSSTTVTTPAGASGLTPSVTYTVNFAEDVRQIVNITDGTSNYSTATAIPLTVFVRRNTAAASGVNNTNSSIFYSPGSFTNAPNVITVNSINALSLSQENILGRNDINLGSDNIFTNTGNQINNNNIERLDFISSAAGFTASNALAFSIIERGGVGANDGFKIAAITSLDSMTGNPNGYGTLFSVASSDYGTTNLDTFSSVAFKDGQASAFTVSQSLRGLLIRPTADLGVTSGNTIYGFSIFANDVSTSGANLIDFTNSTFFPTGTSEGNGGIDLIAGNVGVLTATPVPFDFEPQYGIVALGAAWFIRRQIKKKASK